MDALNLIPNTVLVAIISSLVSILALLLFYGVKKSSIRASTKKTIAESENITVETSMTLIRELQSALESQKNEIEEMKQKIRSLEEHEVKHNQERAELKRKNKELMEQSELDKKEIKKLNIRLEKLNQKMSA